MFEFLSTRWTEIIFPGIVALLSAFFSYRATLKSADIAKMKDTDNQVINLLDNLTIQLSKLTTIFDNLSSDIENLSYFSLTNIQKGQKVIEILNNYLWSTYLLEDSKIRIQVIEAVDNASSLINEIASLENYPLSELETAQTKRNELNKEFREHRVQFLKEGIVFSKGKAKFIKNVETKKFEPKLETANNILGELLDNLNRTDSNIDTLLKRNEKRRPLLATRIVDQKTKLRDVALILERLKTNK